MSRGAAGKSASSACAMRACVRSSSVLGMSVDDRLPCDGVREAVDDRRPPRRLDEAGAHRGIHRRERDVDGCLADADHLAEVDLLAEHCGELEHRPLRRRRASRCGHRTRSPTESGSSMTRWSPRRSASTTGRHIARSRNGLPPVSSPSTSADSRAPAREMPARIAT